MHTSPERLSDLTRQYEQRLACTDAVRFLTLKAATGSESLARDLFAERYPRSAYLTKAAVPPVGIGSGGDALLPPSTDPIITLVQQLTLPQRLGLRKVPFDVPVPVQAALGVYAWVAQNRPKPAGVIDWNAVTNPPGKIAGIVVLSRELVRLSPGTEDVMTRAITTGAVAFADRQLLDPAVALVADVSPASITNGITPITPTGTGLAAQVGELLAALFANRPETTRAALVATPGVVAQLPLAQGTFSNVQIVASPAAGNLVIALDADAVIYSDGGGRTDVSEQATVALDDAPQPPTAATAYTSLWQTNHTGFLVDRMLWWQRLATNAVQTLAVS